MVKVGAGRAVIDLAGVLPHDGFAGVHDSLHIRTLAFENPDGGRACLLSAEETSLRDDAAIREAAAAAVGCAPEAVWVSVTHTFSAPHVRTPEHLPDDAARERNELFARRLVETTRSACEQAVAALEPARFAVAHGRCSINVNRDVETDEGWWLGTNPEGFSDHTLRALQVTAAEGGRTIAVVYSADVQSSVVQGVQDADGRVLVSGDLAGTASRLLEEDGLGVAIFLTGAAADQAPRVRGAGALPELGSILAAEVASALLQAEPLPVRSVGLERHELSLPGQRRADFASLAPTRVYQFEEAAPERTTIHLARLGELCVAGIQPEVESRLGWRLREAVATPFELVTLVNGAQKYLPLERAYDRITYEAMNSGFARGAAERLEDAIFELVKE